MGVVDASECGEVVFFVCIVFGVFVILGGKFNGFFLVFCEYVAVDLCDVFLEHSDVFLYSGFFVHDFVVDRRVCERINVCIQGIFIVFQTIKCFVGWEATKRKGI